VDISDWYYSDSDENHKFFIPPGITLEPDSYLVLVENDSAFTARSQMCDLLGKPDLVMDRMNHEISNAKRLLTHLHMMINHPGLKKLTAMVLL
jgi:hypothetical protein